MGIEMETWFFTILDANGQVSSPSVVVAEGADQMAARAEAQKVLPNVTRLGQGNCLNETLAKQWAAALPQTPRAMTTDFLIP